MKTIRRALILCAVAGASASWSAPAWSAKEPRPADEERVICKKSAPAGTRFRTETCYTAAEWDRLSETTKRNMGEMVFREPKKKKDGK